MTEQSPESLRISAWDDLRHYVRKPSLFDRHANINQFFQTLWMVYFMGTTIFRSFDEFHDEARKRAEIARKGLAKR